MSAFELLKHQFKKRKTMGGRDSQSDGCCWSASSLTPMMLPSAVPARLAAFAAAWRRRRRRRRNPPSVTKISTSEPAKQNSERSRVPHLFSFALGPPFHDELTPLLRKHGQVARRVLDRIDRFELLRKRHPAIQKGGLQVVHQQVDARLFVVVEVVKVELAPLARHAREGELVPLPLIIFRIPSRLPRRDPFPRSPRRSTRPSRSTTSLGNQFRLAVRVIVVPIKPIAGDFGPALIEVVPLSIDAPRVLFPLDLVQSGRRRFRQRTGRFVPTDADRPRRVPLAPPSRRGRAATRARGRVPRVAVGPTGTAAS